MANCGLVSIIVALISVVFATIAGWNAWSAYSKVSTKRSETVKGNDANNGTAFWVGMANGANSPVYVFAGARMPKTDLTDCDAVFDGLSVTLVDINDTDDLNPLEDFDGIDSTGKFTLTKRCKTGVVGSTYSSFPVVATFDYAVCKANCDKHISGWGNIGEEILPNWPVNYVIQVDSTFKNSDGDKVGVYMVDQGAVNYVTDTWARLNDTAGDEIGYLYWSIPIFLVLAVVSCFTMESDQPGSDFEQELNQS